MNRTSPDSRFGDWKFPEEIELVDMQTHPIWLDCMLISMFFDVEDCPLGGDETSSRPVLNTNNVLPAMRHALILLRVENTSKFAAGIYNCDSQNLSCVTVYNADGSSVCDATDSPQMVYLSVPKIDGVPNLRFQSVINDPQSAEQWKGSA